MDAGKRMCISHMYVKKVTQNSLVGEKTRVKKQDEKRSNTGKRERERKLKAETDNRNMCKAMQVQNRTINFSS